jgi:tubulin polyglutamylase TTLL6/13
MYVVIVHLYPLEIRLYDEGLVRFATIDYKTPSTDNLDQIYMHLTNYSVNKRHVNYRHAINSQQVDGSKRKLTSIWTQLTRVFGNDRIERTKSSIEQLIIRTILAIQPELRVEYQFELSAGERKEQISCFQVEHVEYLFEHMFVVFTRYSSC